MSSIGLNYQVERITRTCKHPITIQL